jgi:hypothetical protein
MVCLDSITSVQRVSHRERRDVLSAHFAPALTVPPTFHSLQISHWRGIREVLESNGTEVMITRVPATSSIKDRAKILLETIEERYEGREVNLVGHSMVSCWTNG